MIEDRFIFVASALFGIGIWIFIALRNHANRKAKSTVVASNLLRLLVIAFAISLVGHIASRWGNQPDGQIFGLGTILAFILGSIVGSFSARFVWSLFGARFGAKDPLIGVLVLLLLVIVYSLPVYQREVTRLLTHLGISTVKTPVIELTFTERSQFRGSQAPAVGSTSGTNPASIPRPSDPRPGLKGLEDALKGYMSRDREYIKYFEPTIKEDFIGDIYPIATSAAMIAECLNAYATIIPDSQLLLIDIRPALQHLFRMQNHAVGSLTYRKNHLVESIEQADREFTDFKQVALDIRVNVFEALGIRSRSWVRTSGMPKQLATIAGENQNDPTDKDIEQNLKRLGATSAQIRQFTDYCSIQALVDPFPGSAVKRFTYLQPYTAIALANLLVAHGASDEAIEVLTQWLDLWHCARARKSDDNPAQKCNFDPVERSEQLPEWFAIRAEFELNLLMYQVARETNVAYHEFLKVHAQHYRDYLRQAPADVIVSDHKEARRISIEEELQRCLDKKEMTQPLHIRGPILRSLVQNEGTLLRSYLSFLADLSWSEMANLVDRARRLSAFRVACIYPDAGANQEFWEAVIYDYKITAGLLGLAVADRIRKTADSADLRKYSEDMRTHAKDDLFAGYRGLKEIRDADRRAAMHQPLSRRVFVVSSWEDSCSLAERAVLQLNDPGQ
jgi:hypothetical protein